MNSRQKKLVQQFLDDNDDIQKLVHGGCIGADIDFHNMSDIYPTEVFPGHPSGDPMDTSMMGDFEDATTIHEPQNYFKRNRDIVDMSDVILATPYNNVRNGGTWYTIKYAKSKNKKVLIFTREEL